jgi:predicted transposase/invertase (TIGR01784 family)
MGIEELILDRAIKQGIQQGSYNSAIKIARELKKEGLAIEFIAKVTNLSSKEV